MRLDGVRDVIAVIVAPHENTKTHAKLTSSPDSWRIADVLASTMTAVSIVRGLYSEICGKPKGVGHFSLLSTAIYTKNFPLTPKI